MCLLLYCCTNLPAQSTVDSLIRVADQQSKQLNKDDYKQNYASTLHHIGESWFSSGKFQNAASIFSKAADLYLQTGQIKKSADIRCEMADCYSRMDQKDSAILSLKMAVRQYQSIRDTAGTAMAMATAGYCYFQLSDVANAIRMVEEAVSIAEQSTDEKVKAICYRYLALFSGKEGGDIQKAKSYTLREAAILQSIGDSANFYNAIIALANLQRRSAAYDSATVLFRNALRYFTFLNKQHETGMALHNIGATYAAQLQFDSAVIYNNKAIEKFYSVNDSTSLAGEYCRLGSNLAASGKLAAAIDAFMAGWHIASVRDDPANQQDLALGLSEALEQSSNYEEALQYYKRYSLLSDSLKRAEAAKKFAAIKRLNALREMERLDTVISHDSSWEAKASTGQKIIRLLLIGITVLLLNVAALLFNRFRCKKSVALQDKQKDILIEEERRNSAIQRLRAEQADKFKSVFIAKMSREILTPIHLISGFTNLLEDEQEQERRFEYLSAIRKSTANLLALHQDVLDLRAMEDGKLKLEKTPFRLNDVLDFIDAKGTTGAIEKKLHWQLRVAHDVPALLMGDAAKLKQLLVKLADNAIKFTESGTVTLEVSKDHSTDIILFKVTDTGAGISEERLQQILTNFSQPASQTQNAGSDGIGLNICSKLAVLMNGRLDVDSKAGLGSTFYYFMPYEVASAAQYESLQEDELMTAGRSGASLAGIKILIGDSSEDDHMLLRETLKKFIPGLIVNCCKSGNEVLAALETQAERTSINEALHDLAKGTLQPAQGYSLLLLNVDVPAMDGYTVAGYIRQQLRNPIPIIALSTFANAAVNDRLLKTGINSYLLKPFSAKDLMLAIAGALKINAASMNENNLFQTPDSDPYTVAATPPEKYQWIHLDHLEKLVAQDPIQIQRYLRLFHELIPARILALQNALEQRDFPLIRKTVHVMKPQLASLGMSNARKLAESIESNYHREERIQPAAEVLITQCLAALEEVKQEMGMNTKS